MSSTPVITPRSTLRVYLAVASDLKGALTMRSISVGISSRASGVSGPREAAGRVDGGTPSGP
ncbi:hypothetical protein [Pseudonocardia xishanensis]|uniref:hypothetical protein n=1 Tax=Pseudonocardia xishanensis TaxID=630995 RepID=UPI0031F0FBFD